MKIVIASDSYKGSLSSRAVGEAMAMGIRRIFPDAVIRIVAVADGGEGTVEAVVGDDRSRLKTVTVENPLGQPVDAIYGIIGDTAIIEMAAASGLTLIPESCKNPLRTSTFGTGQLIRAALDQGVRRIIVGIGGSATNDGGVGMAQALGIRFTDAHGCEIGRGGDAVGRIHHIDLSQRDPRLDRVEMIIACDVTNPLLGDTGASRVYGPQKGADPQMVERLETNLSHLHRVVKASLGLDMANRPGAGAAGGLGYGLMVFCGATMQSGIDTILDTMDFDRTIQDADLVLTGEGKIDRQSAFGKVPVGIAARAKKYGIPVVAIAGGVSSDGTEVYHHGIDALESAVNRIMSIEDAMHDAGNLIMDATERVMRLIRVGRDL